MIIVIMGFPAIFIPLAVLSIYAGGGFLATGLLASMMTVFEVAALSIAFKELATGYVA